MGKGNFGGEKAIYVETNNEVYDTIKFRTVSSLRSET